MERTTKQWPDGYYWVRWNKDSSLEIIWVEDGFFYKFDWEEPFSTDELDGAMLYRIEPPAELG